MTIDPKEKGAPIPLPDSIYDAFKAKGYDPVTVIMIDKGGEHKTFIKPEAFEIFPTFTGNVENLTAPHMTMQQSDLTKSGFRWCLWCTRAGCFWVPC